MRIFLLFTVLMVAGVANAQGPLQWTPDGNGYFRRNKNEIQYYSLTGAKDSVFLRAAQLTPEGAAAPLVIKSWSLSEQQDKVLLFT
ncbi:hypothetical protein, partial [Flavihumibacter sp. CACIAM 22H1]|uniref:hypothetical protein n=1 Tax=Flavihumibacter sp. CACIAM 22H1 TaxID=1812911 RepID=UPI0025BE97CB